MMGVATRSGLAGAVLALAMGQAAAAGLPSVVAADDEAEKANPGRSERREQLHPHHHRHHDFHATLDRVFGEGRWRQTSGFRTTAQENALRRAGAGTVAAGRLSKHSVGDQAAPGAVDAVVPGMTLRAAAERLRRDGEGVDRVVAERAHGREGAHLHIELTSAAGAEPPP